MSSFGFNAQDAIDSAVAKIKDPFQRYFRKPLDMKGALERNDFPEGFVITPYNRDGKELRNDIIRLKGDMAPIVPFSFSGSQRLVADYYPGNSEPTVHVLGPLEDEIIINGRLKAKRFTEKLIGEPLDPELARQLRQIPFEVQKNIDTIRLNGFLIQIQLGEFSRWGFIKQAMFEMQTLADINYKITFLIVGFNKPRDYIIVKKSGEIPFSINKELIAKVAEFQSKFGTVPDSIPKSLADQISENIAAVAEAINLVTGFVDNILNEVDSIKDSVQRGLGLIQNARNNLTRMQRRVGSLASFGGISTSGGFGISSSYTNANYVAQTLSASFSLTAFLAAMTAQLKTYIDKLPISRHRVQDGDTLQTIAIKYYNDSSKWSQVYDHNKLQDTVLTKGTVLEIPRI